VPPQAVPSDLGYLTKQENFRVDGVDPLIIRSLLDKQQFHDPLGLALHLGISSATWPLFGLLWPSGSRLAERMALRPVNPVERILEIGCGLALSSLVGHRRGANMTASDCHPETAAFLLENLRLNDLTPMHYRHGQWGLQPVIQNSDIALTGKFDLIVGSDILYERDEQGMLAQFIDTHAEQAAEVWVVDPNRGNRSHFNRNMAALGFALHEELLDRHAIEGLGGQAAYKGRMLTYTRS
jgi:predicted nicotinamide N-methyase